MLSPGLTELVAHRQPGMSTTDDDCIDLPVHGSPFRVSRFMFRAASLVRNGVSCPSSFPSRDLLREISRIFRRPSAKQKS